MFFICTCIHMLSSTMSLLHPIKTYKQNKSYITEHKNSLLFLLFLRPQKEHQLQSPHGWVSTKLPSTVLLFIVTSVYWTSWNSERKKRQGKHNHVKTKNDKTLINMKNLIPQQIEFTSRSTILFSLCNKVQFLCIKVQCLFCKAQFILIVSNVKK